MCEKNCADREALEKLREAILAIHCNFHIYAGNPLGDAIQAAYALAFPPVEVKPDPDAPCGYVYRGDVRYGRGKDDLVGAAAGTRCAFIKSAHDSPEGSHDWIPVPEAPKPDTREAEIAELRATVRTLASMVGKEGGGE